MIATHYTIRSYSAPVDRMVREHVLAIKLFGRYFVMTWVWA